MDLSNLFPRPYECTSTHRAVLFVKQEAGSDLEKLDDLLANARTELRDALEVCDKLREDVMEPMFEVLEALRQFMSEGKILTNAFRDTAEQAFEKLAEIRVWKDEEYLLQKAKNGLGEARRLSFRIADVMAAEQELKQVRADTL
jgi:hypothetical protein